MTTENPIQEAVATADAVRHHLAFGLPTDQLVIESVQRALAHAQRDVLPLAGRPLAGVLLASGGDVELLRTVKDCAKQLAVRHTADRSLYDAALTIYFAAIATALAHHHEKISAHSYATLAESFVLLAARPWMPAELVALFARAQVLAAGNGLPENGLQRAQVWPMYVPDEHHVAESTDAPVRRTRRGEASQSPS
jgi:hypothetical protein